MDHDDDVEHLFSWLQTPELRYREFAGAREITDAIVTQSRPRPTDTPEPPPGNAQLREEYPADQFPDQRDAPEDVVTRAPEVPAAPNVPPTVPATAEAPMPRSPAPDAPAPFALGSEGRGGPRRPQYEEPVPPPPAGRVDMPPPPPPPPLPPPAATAGVPPVSSRPQPAGAGLLGGAYREDGLNGHDVQAEASEPGAAAPRTEHSLDAVFGRLAAGRNRPTDPRERLRHIPGLGPPTNRSR